MAPLYLDEDQAMLRDTAAPFLAEQAPVAHLRRLRDSGDATGFSRDLWREFATLGFTGILVSEADGGLGLGHVEVGVVLEEIGRNLTPSPFLSTAVGAVSALAAGGADARARWLPDIVAGETVAALAVDEGPKHRPERVALAAKRAGNGFRLDGVKNFVAHGHVADLFVVSARTAGGPGDRAGLTLFAIPADRAGLSSTPRRLADASFASTVRFDGVEVDADAVLGEVDAGWAPLNTLLDAVRTGASSELLGVGSGALALTVDYLKTRKQFGVHVGSFQALQHRAAHLYCEVEVARAAVLKAQQRLDARDAHADRAVMVAKAMSSMAARLAVQEGVQMHGGVGMTDEYDIGLYMKRERVLAESFGDENFHADRLAQLSGY